MVIKNIERITIPTVLLSAYIPTKQVNAKSMARVIRTTIIKYENFMFETPALAINKSSGNNPTSIKMGNRNFPFPSIFVHFFAFLTTINLCSYFISKTISNSSSKEVI